MRPEDIREVIALYEKHGWLLRRVLLSQPRADLLQLFGTAPVRKARIDAVWFSRRSQPDTEAWELRRLSGSPFALVSVVADGTPDHEVEAILDDVEEEMSAAPVGEISH